MIYLEFENVVVQDHPGRDPGHHQDQVAQDSQAREYTALYKYNTIGQLISICLSIFLSFYLSTFSC